jgi:hypothetical protein
MRVQEIEGFVHGLFGSEDEIDLPELTDAVLVSQITFCAIDARKRIDGSSVFHVVASTLYRLDGREEAECIVVRRGRGTLCCLCLEFRADTNIDLLSPRL